MLSYEHLYPPLDIILPSRETHERCDHPYIKLDLDLVRQTMHISARIRTTRSNCLYHSVRWAGINSNVHQKNEETF